MNRLVAFCVLLLAVFFDADLNAQTNREFPYLGEAFFDGEQVYIAETFGRNKARKRITRILVLDQSGALKRVLSSDSLASPLNGWKVTASGGNLLCSNCVEQHKEKLGRVVLLPFQKNNPMNLEGIQVECREEYRRGFWGAGIAVEGDTLVVNWVLRSSAVRKPRAVAKAPSKDVSMGKTNSDPFEVSETKLGATSIGSIDWGSHLSIFQLRNGNLRQIQTIQETDTFVGGKFALDGDQLFVFWQDASKTQLRVYEQAAGGRFRHVQSLPLQSSIDTDLMLQDMEVSKQYVVLPVRIHLPKGRFKEYRWAFKRDSTGRLLDVSPTKIQLPQTSFEHRSVLNESRLAVAEVSRAGERKRGESVWIWIYDLASSNPGKPVSNVEIQTRATDASYLTDLLYFKNKLWTISNTIMSKGPSFLRVYNEDDEGNFTLLKETNSYLLRQ